VVRPEYTADASVLQAMAATATTTATPLRAAPSPAALSPSGRLRDLPAAAALERRARFDPRLCQIAALSGLLVYGLLQLGAEVRRGQAAVILGTRLAAQYACTRAWRLPAFGPRSALLSGLSLCLLLRTGSLFLATLAAVLAVAGKFLVRVRG